MADVLSRPPADDALRLLVWLRTAWHDGRPLTDQRATWRGVEVRREADAWVVGETRWPSMRAAWRALQALPERRTA